MKAYILIGMVGSGKTAWARMTAGTNFNIIRVSSDDIRNMIKDRYTFDFQLEPLVDKIMMAMVREVLAAGKDVVIDDCNLTFAGRDKLCKNLVDIAQDGIEITYVWMNCSDDIALKRRLTNLKGRTEFEWREVIKKHRSMFESPEKDENMYRVNIIEVDNE